MTYDQMQQLPIGTRVCYVRFRYDHSCAVEPAVILATSGYDFVDKLAYKSETNRIAHNCSQCFLTLEDAEAWLTDQFTLCISSLRNNWPKEDDQ